MSIEVTVRHSDALGDLQEEARQQAQALMDDFPGVEHVHIVLNVEKHRHLAEVVVQGRRRARFESLESSDNMRASLRAAMDKVTKQLGKRREKIHDHKAAMKQFALKRKVPRGVKAQ